MYPRLIFTAFLVFVCAGLLAQAEITSITYQGNEAILTRNTPPPGITYYWQGTSCGTLMNSTSSTTIATADGTYFLRAYTSSGALWATTCASTMVVFPDVTPPVLSNVTPGPIEEGDPIAATSNEAGMIYLVPNGTAANYGAIVAAAESSAAATAGVPVSLSTAGIGMGDFVVYAADGAHNISSASAVITVTDLTPPVLSDVTVGPIDEDDPIAATSNEAGVIYLVPDGTAANYGAIVAAEVSSAAATAGVPVSLSTAGIGMGDFIVYAVDAHNNVSTASAVITITDLTPPVLSDVSTGTVGEGSPIAATSNEDGTIFLVPEGTAGNIGAISAAQVAEAPATAGTPVSLPTSGLDLGAYVVYAVDAYDNVSAASAVITLVDLTAPILSDVTEGPIEVGTDILATSNEDGMLYLVPDGTAPNVGDISAAQVAQVVASANVPGTLSTSGIDLGDYVVYAVDASDNVSAASPAITVTAATYIDLNSANPHQVQLYPVNVVDILHIRSNIPVASVRVYALTGARVISIDTPTDRVDMSRLHAGVYIVNITLEDQVIFTGKVTKK